MPFPRRALLEGDKTVHHNGSYVTVFPPVAPPVAPVSAVSAPVAPPVAPVSAMSPPVAPVSAVSPPVSPPVAPVSAVSPPVSPPVAPVSAVSPPVSPPVAPVSAVSPPLAPVSAVSPPLASESAVSPPVALPVAPVSPPVASVSAVSPPLAPVSAVSPPLAPVSAVSPPLASESAVSPPVALPVAPVSPPVASVSAASVVMPTVPHLHFLVESLDQASAIVKITMAALNPAKLKVILGENNVEKLTLPNGIPQSLVELINIVKITFGLTADIRLQYMDKDFGNKFFTLNATTDLQDLGTIKVVQQEIVPLVITLADAATPSFASDENLALIMAAMGWKQRLKYKMGNFRTQLKLSGCPELSVNSLKSKAPSDASPARGVKKPRRAEANFYPALPTGETYASLEQERLALLTEVKIRHNDRVIADKMARTFAYRRQEVVNQEPESWILKTGGQPFFISERVPEIVAFPLEQRFLSQLDMYSSKLITTIRARGGATREKTAGIIHIFDQDSHRAEMLRDLEDVTMAVFVIRTEVHCLEEPPVDIGVVIEGVEVLNGLSSVASACALLLGLIYVLNLAYPKSLRVTFEVFQKVIMELEPQKMSPKVTRELNISHRFSSAYHPESQGALERFHQTLKAMLRAYCLELEKEWDEGVPLLLFAAREVVQESTGFSPADLVFAHNVRGPLKLLQENWLNDTKSQNVLDYVSSFRFKLYRACELAKEKLSVAQEKMKSWFDKSAKPRQFEVGDKVLVFLPLLGSSLQARYSGPYTIQKKVNERDYIVATPDRTRRNRLCHVNMLKPYFERERCDKSSPDSGAVLVLSSAQPDVSPVPLSSSLQVLDAVSLSGAEGVSGVPEELSSAENDGDIPGPSAALVQGRLQNSEVLSTLDNHFLHLPVDQRTDILALICSHLSLFSDVPSRTHVLHHDIDVGDNAPIKQHPYRVNPDKRQRLQSQVDYMTSHGIAEPSSSPWSSPCLLAIKSDGSDRFCTDFRKVNSVTKPDSHPLPRMDDCVDRVGSAIFVTKLDLLKGYWQVPLTPRAKEVCAFVTPDAFLQYTVMPFGVRNAPATFQRLVNLVLRGVPGCDAYLDDIVVHSKSWDEHICQLREVFERLDKANLTINLAKCEFAKATVLYLGKIVGGGSVKPVHAKIEAVASFPVPTSRRELQRFLGMAGYYRSFCNFSAVAAPLTNLLSPKTQFKWSPECQHSFDSIKTLLMKAPVLSAPDYDRPFKIAVDASDAGAGAVLLQDGPDHVEHPVSYFSKKFLKHQRAYSTIEKETLALIMALKQFEVYVGSSSRPVLVYTDHNPLVFINQMRNANQRLMRWALFLQDFNLSIKHISGRNNVLADALSRSAR
ncbi:hypothetical protein WMY93_010150 [Mugilogobius chulae]|uniref:ribonuclease H n=1 Tax=Mugilogobius chulae TaxID=88201 RepID=A0AAW0PI18_9GOBI